MDDTDLKILRILQTDSAISTVDLALRVGLSHTPCWRRVKALEESGAIRCRAGEVPRVRAAQQRGGALLALAQQWQCAAAIELRAAAGRLFAHGPILVIEHARETLEKVTARLVQVQANASSRPVP